jgi:hypothetical protein
MLYFISTFVLILKYNIMEVNKTLIDITTIYETSTPTEIWSVLDTLIGAVDDLEENKTYHLENPYNGIDIAKEIQSINEQLYYVKANIDTLKIALKVYEEEVRTQIFNAEYFEPTYWN